ncbi:hypothetical protein VPHD260_0088 [Vibrio phage D260]
MSKLITELSKLRKRFTYKRDVNKKGKRVDYWRVLPKTGAVQGDCEDFSLTVAVNTYGTLWNAYQEGCTMVFCKFRGGGHAILKTPEGHIDNIQYRPFDPEKLSNYSDMRNMTRVEVYFRIILAKLRM